MKKSVMINLVVYNAFQSMSETPVLSAIKNKIIMSKISVTIYEMSIFIFIFSTSVFFPFVKVETFGQL